MSLLGRHIALLQEYRTALILGGREPGKSTFAASRIPVEGEINHEQYRASVEKWFRTANSTWKCPWIDPTRTSRWKW